MLAQAKNWMGRLKDWRTVSVESPTCVLCGTELHPSERSLQIQCPGCKNYIHVRDMTITKPTHTSKIVTACDVTIEKGGVMNGDLYAHSVTVNGDLKGRLMATGECHLGPTARVLGDILCTHLHISPGAKVEGTIERISVN